MALESFSILIKSSVGISPNCAALMSQGSSLICRFFPLVESADKNILRHSEVSGKPGFLRQSSMWSRIGSLAEADAVPQAVGNESLCERSSCLGTIKHMVPAIKHGAGKCEKIPLNQEERRLPWCWHVL